MSSDTKIAPWEKNGFETLTEACNMIRQADLSTRERSRAFKDWRDNDGSKVGLQKFLKDYPMTDGWKDALA